MDFSKLMDYVKQEEHIMVLYLVGSHDTPYQTPLSDIDFAIISEQKLEFEKQAQILGRFVDLLGTDNVDVIFLPGSGLPIQHKVISSGRLLYSRDETFLADFIECTIKSYGDFEIFLNRFYQDYDAGMRREFGHD